MEYIERLRAQVSLVDSQFQGTRDSVRQAVWSCFQEEPVEFLGRMLYDIGAFPEPPLGGRITQRVPQPWTLPSDEKEQAAVRKMREMVERIKKQKTKGE